MFTEFFIHYFQSCSSYGLHSLTYKNSLIFYNKKKKFNLQKDKLQWGKYNQKEEEYFLDLKSSKIPLIYSWSNSLIQSHIK